MNLSKWMLAGYKSLNILNDSSVWIDDIENIINFLIVADFFLSWFSFTYIDDIQGSRVRVETILTLYYFLFYLINYVQSVKRNSSHTSLHRLSKRMKWKYLILTLTLKCSIVQVMKPPTKNQTNWLLILPLYHFFQLGNIDIFICIYASVM